MEFKYDLVVIGAGSGGLAAAKRAASYGAKVAIIETNQIGGTCVVRGCVPKKLMVYAANARKNMIDAEGYGLSKDRVDFSSEILLKNIKDEVKRLSDIHLNSLERLNIKVFKGLGRFISRNKIEIVSPDTNKLIKVVGADKILISVGGKPKKIKIPGAHFAWSSDDIFNQVKFPKSILIIGGGYIACEFACIFNNLGVDVTQIIRSEKLLNGFDLDLSSSLKEAMLAAGIQLKFKEELVSISKKDRELALDFKSGFIDSKENVLVAAGREPNLSRLNIDSLGLEMKGLFLDVNDCYQTSISNIFAIGDIVDRPNLTPVAIEQGRVFSDTFFGNKKRIINYEFVPKAVFTIPELATVGMSESQAVKTFSIKNIKIYKSQFISMSNTFKKNKFKCLLKVVVTKSNDKVVGCHMFGESASEIIQMVSIAINSGVTKKEFDNTMALHPSVSEEFVTMY